MIPNVQNALDNILGSVVALEHAYGAGRIFELFIMTGIGRMLREKGFFVWLQRSDGTPIEAGDPDRRFIQRGGAPTGIAPASDGPNNASVISFRWPGRPDWEIWNGIQFEGRSGATHEIDIAVVPAGVGDTLRTTGGVPVGRPRVAIECKDVGTNGSLDEARAFVARLYDVTLLHSHHKHMPFAEPRAIHPGSPSEAKYRAVVTYWQENWRTKNIIARRTGFVGGTAPLMDYHCIEPHEHIVAGSVNVEGLFETVAEWAYDHAR